jgi:hypothetical protein
MFTRWFTSTLLSWGTELSSSKTREASLTLNPFILSLMPFLKVDAGTAGVAATGFLTGLAFWATAVIENVTAVSSRGDKYMPHLQPCWWVFYKDSCNKSAVNLVEIN